MKHLEFAVKLLKFQQISITYTVGCPVPLYDNLNFSSVPMFLVLPFFM